MRADLAVSPDWIADNLDDPSLLVVEVDVSPDSYEKGHIPGAVIWDTYRDLRHPDYTPADPDEIDAVLSRFGVTPETTLVFYGYAPYLGLWLMDRHGHERIRVMDGPRERWGAAGHRWSTDVPQTEASVYVRSAERTALVVGRREVEAMLGDDDTRLVDVRSSEEFTGERFWPSGATEGAGRAGRLPGAIHVPVELAQMEDGSLADGQVLRRECERLGFNPEHKIVTYCTIGNRASLVAFALMHQLGYSDVSVYYGSWSEWGSRPDAPVEK